MACARRRQAVAAGARLLAGMGRPVPRRALDVIARVRCGGCGFEGAGAVFRWDGQLGQGRCPRCGSLELSFPEEGA